MKVSKKLNNKISKKLPLILFSNFFKKKDSNVKEATTLILSIADKKHAAPSSVKFLIWNEKAIKYYN